MDTLITDVIGDVALIFVLSSLLGALARRWGQPAVIGQIMAGVILGPSLLGRLPGDPTSILFTTQAVPYLTVFSQLGVTIFMFAVGYEIDLRQVRSSGHAVPLVMVSALLVPMALGILLTLFFRPGFTTLGAANQGLSFSFFMGVATSITALPVLASIVRERGMADTRVGIIATAAAGGMDVLAWLLLAVALLESGRSGHPLRVVLPSISCFVALMLFAVPLGLKWWTRLAPSIFCNPVRVAFALALGGGWVTSSLGLHPLFGGFLAGLAVRAASRELDADVLRSLDQASNLLLPLFFVVTGLSLNVGAMGGTEFALLGLILAVATAGKLVPANERPDRTHRTQRRPDGRDHQQTAVHCPGSDGTDNNSLDRAAAFLDPSKDQYRHRRRTAHDRPGPG